MHVPAVAGETVTWPCLSVAEPEITVLQAPKVAVTADAAPIDIVQVPVPEHPEPPQPVNPPIDGVAVNVMEVPAA